MTNRIDEVFLKDKKIKLMTHVVAGYPDMETSKELVRVMAESGADLVEIQIPFSDPLADGPTIMAANQRALENGITPDDCFAMAKELTACVDIPILFMTYVNIPFHMGFERFIARSAEVGISGLIIPDLPYDERNHHYLRLAKQYGLRAIQVISPDIKIERLKEIVQRAEGFIYTTLKVGITGVSGQIEKNGLAFIDTILRYSGLPIAAGFGISGPEQVKQLQGKSDAAVIGSHILNILNRHGTKAGIAKTAEFIRQCKC